MVVDDEQAGSAGLPPKVQSGVGRELGPDVFQERQDLCPAFPFVGAHPEFVSVDIIGRQVVSDSVEASIRGSNPRRFAPGSPRPASMGTHLHRPELVEADHSRVLRRFLVEPLDAFFLDSNSGSLLSFHVFVRWKVIPFSFRIRCSELWLVFLTAPSFTT